MKRVGEPEGTLAEVLDRGNSAVGFSRSQGINSADESRSASDCFHTGTTIPTRKPSVELSRSGVDSVCYGDPSIRVRVDERALQVSVSELAQGPGQVSSGHRFLIFNRDMREKKGNGDSTGIGIRQNGIERRRGRTGGRYFRVVGGKLVGGDGLFVRAHQGLTGNGMGVSTTVLQGHRVEPLNLE